MENELDVMVNQRIESRILTMLIDTILDSSELDYYGKDLSIRSDDKIITIIKTFYPDDYNGALKRAEAEAEAKAEAELKKIEEARDNG